MRRSLAAALLLLAAAAARAEGDPALVPPDGFRDGWSRTEAARTFNGADLYGHIDGGAEIFLEQGFETLTLARYRRGEEEIVLEVYRMADPPAAWGIYLAKCGKETPDPSFIERHTAGRYQVAFVKGRYYVLVTNDTGAPEAARLLLDIGRFAAERIPAAGPPGILDRLPQAGLVPSSVRIVRGPFGLQAIAGSLGEGDLLLLGGKVTAIAGDYREPGGGTRTLLLADYPSPGSAAAAFAHVRAGLDPLLRLVSSAESRLVFQDSAGRFGAVTREGARLTVELDLAASPAPATGAPAAGPDPAGLLPPRVEGYAPAEADGVYSQDTLFDLIDGGAEVYRSFNVRQVVSRRYAKAGAPDIIADVFDMGSAEDAFGVYHHDRRDGRDAGYGRESESVAGALSLWQDRWFVSIIALDDTPQSAAALDALGKAIDARLPREGDVPELARLLPADGLDRATLTAFRDWAYLATRFDLGEDNILDLDRGTYGLLARYRGGEPGAPLVLLVARYPTEDRARGALGRFRAAWLPAADEEGAARRPGDRWAAAAQAGALVVAVLDAAGRPDIVRLAGGIADRARDGGAGRGRQEGRP